MNYEDTRAYIEKRGKKWDDFIGFYADKPYDVNPNTHYIEYRKKHVYQFVNSNEKTTKR